ncbi:MAG: putative benzoate:H+ symporter BenE [Flavobacteriales bacterium]|jgi:predicted benzoate:H+ symporter BenE
MSGILMILLGVFRLGRFIAKVPKDAALFSATILFSIGSRCVNLRDVESIMTEAHIYDNNLAGRELKG